RHEEQLLLFDASASTDDGTIVRYDWAFGDGETATGRTSWHTYYLAGTYQVTLTVTDDRGLSTTTSPMSLNVSAAPLPVASFTISPTDPAPGVPIIVNAAPSTVLHGRYLV